MPGLKQTLKSNIQVIFLSQKARRQCHPQGFLHFYNHDVSTAQQPRNHLYVAKSLEKIYKSVVVEKFAGESSSKEYIPSNRTVLAVNDAVHGKTERVDDVDDFFNSI